MAAAQKVLYAMGKHEEAQEGAISPVRARAVVLAGWPSGSVLPALKRPGVHLGVGVVGIKRPDLRPAVQQSVNNFNTLH